MEVVVDRFFLQVVTDATYTFSRSVATGRKVSKAQLDFRAEKTSDEKKIIKQTSHRCSGAAGPLYHDNAHQLQIEFEGPDE